MFGTGTSVLFTHQVITVKFLDAIMKNSMHLVHFFGEPLMLAGPVGPVAWINIVEADPNPGLLVFWQEIQNNCSPSGNRETSLPAKPEMLLFHAKL